MICHQFKGGVGTASRKLIVDDGEYTIGVLVQANHGTRSGFLIAGIPLGEKLSDLMPVFRPLDHDAMSPLFLAAAEATEEAIVNALVAAQTMTGIDGNTVHALPQGRLIEILKAAGRCALAET